MCSKLIIIVTSIDVILCFIFNFQKLFIFKHSALESSAFINDLVGKYLGPFQTTMKELFAKQMAVKSHSLFSQESLIIYAQSCNSQLENNRLVKTIEKSLNSIFQSIY